VSTIVHPTGPGWAVVVVAASLVVVEASVAGGSVVGSVVGGVDSTEVVVASVDWVLVPPCTTLLEEHPATHRRVITSTMAPRN
jgi:hypothetical protein